MYVNLSMIIKKMADRRVWADNLPIFRGEGPELLKTCCDSLKLPATLKREVKTPRQTPALVAAGQIRKVILDLAGNQDTNLAKSCF